MSILDYFKHKKDNDKITKNKEADAVLRLPLCHYAEKSFLILAKMPKNF